MESTNSHLSSRKIRFIRSIISFHEWIKELNNIAKIPLILPILIFYGIFPNYLFFDFTRKRKRLKRLMKQFSANRQLSKTDLGFLVSTLNRYTGYSIDQYDFKAHSLICSAGYQYLLKFPSSESSLHILKHVKRPLIHDEWNPALAEKFGMLRQKAVIAFIYGNPTKQDILNLLTGTYLDIDRLDSEVLSGLVEKFFIQADKDGTFLEDFLKIFASSSIERVIEENKELFVKVILYLKECLVALEDSSVIGNQIYDLFESNMSFGELYVDDLYEMSFDISNYKEHLNDEEIKIFEQKYLTFRVMICKILRDQVAQWSMDNFGHKMDFAEYFEKTKAFAKISTGSIVIDDRKDHFDKYY
jgi:hypothetical protein